ncbi:MAG: hypothetical protein ACERKT_03500 [Acidobacteriota bacterium]
MRFFAYLDPGSASALLAAVLAGVAGIGAALRTYGKNFFDKLMFWKKSEPDEAQSAGGDAPEGDESEGDPAEGDAPEGDESEGGKPENANSPEDAASAEPVETPTAPSDADGSPGQ